MDQFGCPADPEELCENYFGFVKSVARKVGVREANLDDAAQEILLRFIAKDFLSEYDPMKLHSTSRGLKRSRFAPFLRRFAFLQALNFRDSQQRWDRESLICDVQVGELGLWVEVHGGSVEFSTLAFELDEEMSRARAHLALITEDGRNLADVFDAIIEVAIEHGRVSGTLLAERLGIFIPETTKPSKTRGTTWLQRIRVELDDIGFQADWAL